jgi:uncharacterized protein (DUF486 family)
MLPELDDWFFEEEASHELTLAALYGLQKLISKKVFLVTSAVFQMKTVISWHFFKSLTCIECDFMNIR